MKSLNPHQLIALNRYMEEFKFKSKARVAISPNCNLKCHYCDNSRNNDQDRVVSMEDFRNTPLSKGVISSEDYIRILEALLRSGFNKVDFTGGEPMLNKAWDLLVCASKHMGFLSVEMTTNGTLISDYLENKLKFPDELDRLKVSIDTNDPKLYNRIVGKKVSLYEIIDGVKRLKEVNPKLKLTANCVLSKSTTANISEYIEFIKEAGFDSITFLDLVVRDTTKTNEIGFFNNEFLSGEIIKQYVQNQFGALDVYKDRHLYNVLLPNGLTISLTDTKGLTKRDEICKQCPCFCQEGLYTVRVATDGFISDCMGPQCICFDAKSSINNQSLDADIKKIYNRLANSKEGCYFDVFLNSLSGGQVG